MPPDRRRTTGTAPKVAPSRPREEANSLAQHEVPPSTQAARGPGAAMVLSQIGCHRAPFGSFPRVGKNTPHARAAGKGSPHLTGATQAHHLARNEGGPPVPPGRQRTTDMTPKAAPSRPREEGLSLAQQEVPPPNQAARGPGAAMVLAQIGCPRSPFGSFPRVGKNTPACPRHGQRNSTPPNRERTPLPRAMGKSPRAGSGAPPRRNRRPASKSPASPQASGSLPAQPPAAAVDDILFILSPFPDKAKPGAYRRALPVCHAYRLMS